MVNVFILEDNLDRIDFFKKRLSQKADNIVVCDDVATAKKELIKIEKWDLILLDHDLDNRVYVDSNESNTGYQLAKFIKNNKIKYDQCITHTHNPAGGQNIKELLGCQFIPFGNLRYLI